MGLQRGRDHAYAGNPYLPSPQKIEPDPANARLLVTEGGGYRLDPEGIPAGRMAAAVNA